jgi:hypothetical protein
MFCSFGAHVSDGTFQNHWTGHWEVWKCPVTPDLIPMDFLL